MGSNNLFSEITLFRIPFLSYMLRNTFQQLHSHNVPSNQMKVSPRNLLQCPRVLAVLSQIGNLCAASRKTYNSNDILSTIFTNYAAYVRTRPFYFSDAASLQGRTSVRKRRFSHPSKQAPKAGGKKHAASNFFFLMFFYICILIGSEHKKA